MSSKKKQPQNAVKKPAPKKTAGQKTNKKPTKTQTKKKRVIRNPNPIITKPKKKKKKLTEKQLFAIRSKANKRGWKTKKLVGKLKDNSKKLTRLSKIRREIAKLEAQVEEEGIRTAEDRVTLAKLSRKRDEETEIRRRLEDLEKKIAEQVEFDLKFKDFVRAEPLEWTHRDGTVAVQPSMLRHLDITEVLYERLMVAKELGIDEYDAECRSIAEETGFELREVYTLGESP